MILAIQYYQILVPILSAILLAVTIRFFLKGQITLFETIIWAIFWLGLAAIALFPDLIGEFIADALGIKETVHAIIFAALGLLFFLQFRLYLILKKQNVFITDLVRKIALQQEIKETEVDE